MLKAGMFTSLFACFAIMLLLAGCGSGQGEEADAKTMEKIQVDDVHYLQTPGGKRYLTGEVYNPTEHALSKVQVLVSLYDDKNRQVDEMNFLVEELPAEKRTSFREPVSSEADVQAARVRSLMHL